LLYDIIKIVNHLEKGKSMEGTVIFEIPIYRMSEKNFGNYLHDAMQKERERYIGLFGESIIPNMDILLDSKFNGKTLWRYNQRIAYIMITMTNRDIFFYFHKPIRNGRANILSDTKIYVNDGFMIGQHFRIESNWLNTDIAQELKEWLNALIRDEAKFLKGKYVDRDLFDRYIDGFNFLALHNSNI
jgi:hypothetical protein